MKKIVIVIPNIVYRAGMERAVVNLSNILSSLGHRVYILSIASNSGNCSYHLDSNVRLVHMNLPYLKSNIFFAFKHYLFIYRKLKLFCSRNNINLVIGTYDIINFVITLLPKKIKTIGCEHFNYEKSGKIKNLLKKIFYRKLDTTVLLTNRDREKYNFLNNTVVIPNSLSFQPLETSLLDQKRMVSLGRLTFQKGYDLLIDAIFLIKDKLNGWVVDIYGSGEDKVKLEEKISLYNLNDIVFIKEPVDDVQSVLCSASVFLSSSRFEGLPMVLIESQSCGIPAVVFDCPCGPAEIVIDGKTGFVVDLFDIESYSDKIMKLINDVQLRTKFGTNAFYESQRFSTESISIQWESLINKLFGGHK